MIKIITTMKDVGLLVDKKRVEDRHRTVVNGGVLVPGKGTIPLIASYLPHAIAHHLEILMRIVMIEIWCLVMSMVLIF